MTTTVTRPERVSVRDLSRRTGWPVARLRQRIHRGALRIERDEDGRVWVPINEAEALVRIAEDERLRAAWATDET